jgi:hypothetical protein
MVLCDMKNFLYYFLSCFFGFILIVQISYLFLCFWFKNAIEIITFMFQEYLKKMMYLLS